MEHAILYAIIPIVVAMMAGYIGGRRGTFDAAAASVLNRLVLNIALPAALFASIVRADRDLLLENIRPTLVALAGIMLCFTLVYEIYKHCFKGNGGSEGAVMALLSGSPAIGFMGFAVLQPLFGTTPQVGLIVAIVGIVVNAVGIPVGLSLLNAASGTASGTMHAVLHALSQPVAWAPLAATALVVCGIHIPEEALPSLDFLAGANSTVAVFAVGIILSKTRIYINAQTILGAILKVVFMPAVLLGIGIVCGLEATTLKMLVLAGVLPSAFTGTMIAERYGVYVAYGASSLALSVLAFIPACPLWLWAVDAILVQV